jgi:two-component system NarL family sensor kinase
LDVPGGVPRPEHPNPLTTFEYTPSIKLFGMLTNDKVELRGPWTLRSKRIMRRVSGKASIQQRFAEVISDSHWGAWAGALVPIVLVTLAFGLAIYLLVTPSDSIVPPPHMLFSPVTTFAFSITGALIASRHPRNPIGWLFEIVGFLSALILLAMAYYGVGQLIHLPGKGFALWLLTWVWIPSSFIPLSFLFLLFPDGRLLSTRWRPIFWASLAGLASVVFAIGFHPDQSLQEAVGLPDSNPYAITGAAGELTAALYLGGVLVGIGLLGSVTSMIVRFRRSRGIKRNQMKWLAYAGFFVIAGIILSSSLTGLFPGNPNIDELAIIVTDLSVAGIAVATWVAISRHRLYDIDLIINRTLVYGALTAIIIASYILVVGLLGAFFQTRGALAVSLVATGLVAVGFQPLRDRLQRGVNRMMYGQRDEPYAVISRLGRRLESTLDPESVLPTIVDTVAQTLKLPYVAIALKRADGFHIAVSSGERSDEQYVLPLSYHGEEIGQLICGLRSAGEPFNTAERNLLKDVAHQASIALHAARLTSDLRRARRRLVRTREEERRRIRRDLHDGLGTILASLRLKIGSASRLLEHDPGEARVLLQETEDGLTIALADVRRLVYDLRPPALDELGLVRAIQQSLPHIPDMDITFDAPAELPELPAAVDVAAYRIIQEALSNSVRHAQASQVSVRIDASEALELSISDNGTGLPTNYQAGVGLISMRERVEELGGTFDLEGTTEQGTTIFVQLPLEDAEL